MKDLERKIVAHLLRRPGDTQTEIAQRLKVDQSNVTRSLLRLKRLGLAELASKGKPPRLTLFARISDLERSVCDLLGCALAKLS